MIERHVDICIAAGRHHCSGAFLSSEHRCGAGILHLTLTVLNMKKGLEAATVD